MQIDFCDKGNHIQLIFKIGQKSPWPQPGVSLRRLVCSKGVYNSRRLGSSLFAEDEFNCF